ncbi:unnamed protein product [Rangifer tarandus platyrhynchus]|uniref:Uncharacterized protein n=1 Tax=Rangifer tarandus platyrhynchus TaxID=3082113 RepID=A0ABN8YZQ2_RANTA|nr:unnamed protein product [Rangifer tarandus platyrhynchus]
MGHRPGLCSARGTQQDGTDRASEEHSLGVGLDQPLPGVAIAPGRCSRADTGCGQNVEEKADSGSAVFMEEVTFELAFEGQAENSPLSKGSEMHSHGSTDSPRKRRLQRRKRAFIHAGDTVLSQMPGLSRNMTRSSHENKAYCFPSCEGN